MKRFLTLGSVLVLALLAGCGDSRESLASESVSTLKEINSVLDGIKDKDSAKAAKPKLKSLIEEMNDINDRQAKLPEPTEAEMKAILDKHGKDMESLQGKFMSNMMRIGMDPSIRGELDDLDMKSVR